MRIGVTGRARPRFKKQKENVPVCVDVSTIYPDAYLNRSLISVLIIPIPNVYHHYQSELKTVRCSLAPINNQQCQTVNRGTTCRICVFVVWLPNPY